MDFQGMLMCPIRNAECLDSPSPGDIGAVVTANEHATSVAQALPPEEDTEQLLQPLRQRLRNDGDVLARSRFRTEERARFIKECEMMMIKTTRAKKNLLSSQSPEKTLSLLQAGGGGGSSQLPLSSRMRQLWDFSESAGNDHSCSSVETNNILQRRDDDDEDDEDDEDVDYKKTTNDDTIVPGMKNLQHNTVKDEDEDDDNDYDDDEVLWSSAKIRRESRRAKLGVQSMREKNDLTEVESFVAEMRRKRMMREEQRQRELDKTRSGNTRRENDKQIAKEEKTEECYQSHLYHENAKQITAYVGINKDHDLDGELEEYSTIRTTKVEQSSPRDAKLQRIREWKQANSLSSTHEHATHAKEATEVASPHIVSENKEKIRDDRKLDDDQQESSSGLTELELKRWWTEHKRANQIQDIMPSFEELADEPTITAS